MAAPSLSLIQPVGSAATPLAERVAAAFALAAAAPGLVLLLGAVRLISRRPPLVAHMRVGQYGEPLWVLKVRTMWTPGERASAGWVERLTDTRVPSLKVGDDSRVTSRLAAFCRRHSIDELPQLAHVVTGRMRWVGPRPMTSVEHFRAHLGLAEHTAPRCNAPWVSAVLSTEGTTQPCFFHAPIGQGPLLEILHAPPAATFRESLDVSSNPTCQRCVCSLYVPGSSS